MTAKVMSISRMDRKFAKERQDISINGTKRTSAKRRTITIGQDVHYLSDIYREISRNTGFSNRIQTKSGSLPGFIEFVGADGTNLAQFDGKRIYIGGTVNELDISKIPNTKESDKNRRRRNKLFSMGNGWCLDHESETCTCEQFTYDKDVTEDEYKKYFEGLGMEQCLKLLQTLHKVGLSNTSEYVLLRRTITDNRKQE